MTTCAHCGAEIILGRNGDHWKWFTRTFLPRGGMKHSYWCDRTVEFPVRVHAPAA